MLLSLGESSNSHSRLAWTLMCSHRLSSTLVDSRALSSNLNLLKFFMRVVESFPSFGPRFMIVDESWILILVWTGLALGLSQAWPYVYFDRGDKIYTQVDTRFRLATQSKSMGPFIREILSVLAKPRSSQNWGVIYMTATNFKRLLYFVIVILL